MLKPTQLALAIAGASLMSQAVAGPEFFGSLNVGVEYRMMEDEDRFPSHSEVQDAYSYIGVKGEEDVQEGLKAFYEYKLYVNVADGELSKSDQTAWYGRDVRREHNVAKVGLKTEYGSVSVGRMWNAYYNHIAYTTDRFYSGWTGFDTYATFQVDRAVTYQNSFGGLSVGVNLVQGGAEDAANGDTNRVIIGGTYNIGNANISLGYDNQGDDTQDADGDDVSNDLIAIAGDYTIGDLRLAAKYETSGEGAGNAVDNGQPDDSALTSLMAQYTMGANSFTLHYGFGDYPGYLPVNNDDSDADKRGEGSEYGIGYARVMSDNLTYFAEYHASDDYCAYDVTGNADGTEDVGGCSVVTTGVHYSF